MLRIGYGFLIIIASEFTVFFFVKVMLLYCFAVRCTTALPIFSSSAASPCFLPIVFFYCLANCNYQIYNYCLAVPGTSSIRCPNQLGSIHSVVPWATVLCDFMCCCGQYMVLSVRSEIWYWCIFHKIE